ncbi:MAG: endonuclease/exonuclease/phosphatase family protein [Planctomycetes bacterium]|nr:endonuclease/exonuclease/phosphatase family protein [Planctomycetota bacterium]
MLRLALAAALLLSGCTAPHGDATTSTPFTATTCNVRYGTADDGDNAWPKRRELLATTLLQVRPDILGVQEALAFQLDFLAAKLPHHRRLGQGRDGGERGEHAALFIDTRRFEVLDHGDFWLSETPATPASIGWDAALPRICTWAALRELGTGRAMQVWNVHFDHRGATARHESAKLLARRIAATVGPHVVLGDFNAGEDSAPLDALRAAGLRDTFRDVAPAATAVGTFHGFRGGHRGAKIDYVLAGAGLETADAAILDAPGPGGNWPSDHHFVTAKLMFSRSRDGQAR